ncbi:MAG: hypothetical protein AAB583_06790 [Patescibacteria group bacterium]
MFDNYRKHGGHYLSLFLILALGFLLAYVNSSNRQLQIGIVALTTLAYVSWGILHHMLNHDLNMKIVIEYVLIGCFGLAVVVFLLKGGLGI